MKIVRDEDGVWHLVSGEITIARFASGEEAWSFYDKMDDKSLEDEERRRRIDTAFA